MSLNFLKVESPIMKIYLISISLLFVFASNAWAATAYFTGRQEQVTTVTGQQASNCEYRYMDKTFWKVFEIYACPMSIEIQ